MSLPVLFGSIGGLCVITVVILSLIYFWIGFKGCSPVAKPLAMALIFAGVSSLSLLTLAVVYLTAMQDVLGFVSLSWASVILSVWLHYRAFSLHLSAEI